MTEIKRLNPSMQLEFRYVHQTVYEQLNDLDALFIIGKFALDPDHELVKAIRYKVIVDYPAPENCFDSIQVNFKEVVYQAMDYLRQNGRKKDVYKRQNQGCRTDKIVVGRQPFL